MQLSTKIAVMAPETAITEKLLLDSYRAIPNKKIQESIIKIPPTPPGMTIDGANPIHKKAPDR